MCNPEIASKCMAPAALNAFLVSVDSADLSPRNKACASPT